tara:strand:+ start:23676 stop:24170 length:495 start_codon:yes stop_codon:yes gene_type:complete
VKKEVDINPYSRKQFLKTAGSTALFATLGIGFVGCSDSSMDAISSEPSMRPGSDAITISNNGNKIEIDLNDDSVSGLRSEGGWLLVDDARTLVVNVGDNVIRAFTSVCTHQQCFRDWRFSNSLFECTCHGSRFNTSGEVVRGPATRDLAEFTVVIENNTVTITK